MKKAFTLIETLIAISVLLLGVAGAFSAAGQGLSSSTYSKDQITAFYLAQEAIEKIRNIRDTNGIQQVNWLTGIAQNPGDPCYFDASNRGYCTVDVLTSTLTSCGTSSGQCPVLHQDPSTGFYTYNNNYPATIFTRQIMTSYINSREFKITVTVSWTHGIQSHSFVADENLLKWQ